MRNIKDCELAHRPVQKEGSLAFDKDLSLLPAAGAAWTEPSIGAEFVWVPGGCFEMGSNVGCFDEKPVHRVCVDGFWMSLCRRFLDGEI